MEQKVDRADSGRGENLIQEVKEHLKEHRPKMFKELQSSGQLEDYLKKNVRSALEMEDKIYERMKKKDPPPESDDLMVKVRHLNWLKQSAWEQVRGQLFPPTEKDQRSL